MLEMVDICEVGQFFKVLYDKSLHGLHSGGFSKKEDDAVGLLPGLLGSREAVVHASTASLELMSKRTTALELAVAMLGIGICSVGVVWFGDSELRFIVET